VARSCRERTQKDAEQFRGVVEAGGVYRVSWCTKKQVRSQLDHNGRGAALLPSAPILFDPASTTPPNCSASFCVPSRQLWATFPNFLDCFLLSGWLVIWQCLCLCTHLKTTSPSPHLRYLLLFCLYQAVIMALFNCLFVSSQS